MGLQASILLEGQWTVQQQQASSFLFQISIESQKNSGNWQIPDSNLWFRKFLPSKHLLDFLTIAQKLHQLSNREILPSIAFLPLDFPVSVGQLSTPPPNIPRIWGVPALEPVQWGSHHRCPWTSLYPSRWWCKSWNLLLPHTKIKRFGYQISTSILWLKPGIFRPNICQWTSCCLEGDLMCLMHDKELTVCWTCWVRPGCL